LYLILELLLGHAAQLAPRALPHVGHQLLAVAAKEAGRSSLPEKVAAAEHHVAADGAAADILEDHVDAQLHGDVGKRPQEAKDATLRLPVAARLTLHLLAAELARRGLIHGAPRQVE